MPWINNINIKRKYSFNFLFLILFLFFSVSSPALENKDFKQKKVLLLNSYHKGFSWTDEITRGVEDTFLNSGLDLHIEYMDTKRQFTQEYQELLEKILKIKHTKHKYDLVITSDNNAFNFFLNVGRDILGNIPGVFCGVNFLTPRDLKGVNGITGVNEKTNIVDNIKLIKKLQPAVNQIIIIADDTETGRQIQKEFNRIKLNFNNINLKFINKATVSELIDYLPTLKTNTAVLLTVFFRDREKRFIEYDKSAEIISQASSVPVYGSWDFSLGHGIIGGYLVSGYDQGIVAAKKALEILAGTNVDAIPVKYETPTRLRFDYRQLEKFNISKVKLPPEAKILYKPVSFYSQYKKIILGFAFIFCLLLIAFLGVSYGLIRSRNAEKKLRRNEENLSTTLHSIADAVIATNSKGQVVRMNLVAENLVGYSFEEAARKNLNEILTLIDSKNRKELKIPIEEVLNTGSTLEITNRAILVSKDASEYLISGSEAPIINHLGKISGVVIVFRDITEKIALLEQLGHRHKMDAIGQLAGGVAHDFNNMLGGIIGAAQLLKSDKRGLDKKSLKYVDMIMQASTRAADLTAKLLTFGRKRKIASKLVNMHDILNDTVEILNRTVDKKISITVNCKAVDFMIYGDTSALQSSFMNLGINASHAMPNGGELKISTNNIKFDENYCSSSQFDLKPGVYFEIEIRDTGCGISRKNIVKIFEPFYTTKDLGKGTGLGLAAVYRTIQDHHGAINVYSEVGTGTVFHIYFPCSAEKESSRFEQPDIIEGTGLILLIDDEEIIRETGKIMLENMGYEVMLAENGKKALEVFKQLYTEINLVITDMIMPEMDGGETFREIKKIDKEAKVVIASGFADKKELEKLEAEGVSGCIHKPYRDYQLSQLLAKTLKKN